MEHLLPPCEPQFPLCGVCLSELSHDGGSFVCQEGLLDFGEGSGLGAPEFLDADAQACAHDCKEPHLHPRTHEGFRYVCEPCLLPTGHAGDCFYGHRSIVDTGLDQVRAK